MRRWRKSKRRETENEGEITRWRERSSCRSKKRKVWSVLCKKRANEKRGSNSRVLAKLAEIVIVCDGDDEGKALRKLSLADGGDEGRSAVTSRSEVGVANLLALLAHELRVDR